MRELENIIERAVVLAEDSMITHEDLELSHGSNEVVLLNYTAVPVSVEELKETKRHLREHAVEDVEKAFVVNALQRSRGNVTRAAEETGMLRPNFQAMMKKLGVSAREYVES